MSGELGKASLEVTADLSSYDRNIRAARREGEQLDATLQALAAVSKVAENALKDVKMSPGQGAETKASAEGILSGVRGISDEARTAARELDKVRLTEAQAAESVVAGDEIDHKLKDITGNANEARRSLDRVKLRIAGIAGLGGPGGGRSGVGVGPFGSGYGRLGVFGTAVGIGALTAPAAAPGALGLLASIPVLAGTGAGALGTLALAFQGVGKAISGDAKAFKDLGPQAQKFVLTVRSLDGWFDKLKETAAGSLFPGLTAALRSALSPGTVSAITKAVTEFGHALGSAAQQWGKYFGSAQFQQLFGPLMQAGARNLGVLSDAALHLFDALGVLGKAAIPFTSWLTRMIDAGSRFVDSWLKAKSATGELGGALDEAKTSLTLVVKLVQSLWNVVMSLGRALYPLAKVAVKDLTDGLNALAKIIDRNKDKIREIVGGALAALVSAVKTLVPILGDLIRLLDRIAHAIGGWKTAFEIVIGGFLALKFAALATKIGGVWTALGKIGPAIGKIGIASETAVGEVGGLRAALLGLGAPEVLAAIAAAVAAYEGFKILKDQFTHPSLPGSPTPQKGGTLPGDPPGDNANWGDAEWNQYFKNHKITHPGFVYKNGMWQRVPGSTQPFSNTPAHAVRQPTTAMPYLDYLLAQAIGTKSTADDKSVYQRMITTLQKRLAKATTLDAKTALQQAINEDRSALQGLSAASPFGTPPPFTKNLGPKGTGAGSVPPVAAHDIQLASANASRASVLGNVGKVAQGYLNAELKDLEAADKLIKTKYDHATGKARTQLFAALTSVENKMRSVRKLLGKAIVDSRAADLQFAVDQAKDAVASAVEGTAAYTKAIAAEEKALRAQIAYLDARAKNSHLSLAARGKAIRAETTDKKELAALLKQSAVSAGESAKNEAQFVQLYKGIIDAGRSNYFEKPGGGKTDTHLHDIKTELKQQTPLLKAAVDRVGTPGTDYALVTAGAVAG